VYDPTSEQQAILSLVRDTKSNILINAYAGTGKTTIARLLAGESRGGGRCAKVVCTCGVPRLFTPE